MNDIAFVIPYVNGDDPVWQNKFLIHGGVYDNDNKGGIPRYRDYGTCELLLDSIDKFAKGADIYMIVAMPSQIPEYAKNRNIKFIYHSDFLPEQFQPCVFQSNAIETFIGRMNLPEKFVGLNDDIIFVRPVYPSDFFNENDDPKYNIRLKDQDGRWSQDGNISNYKMLFPGCIEPKLIDNDHGPTPMRMSWCKELYQKYESELLSSVGSIVRRDVGQVNQLLYSTYAYFYKSLKPSKLKGASVTTLHPVVLKHNYGICINGHKSNLQHVKDGLVTFV